MAFMSLSRRDADVLEKINDPESDPTRAPLIDAGLAKDPHVQALYGQVSQCEREIIEPLQELEMKLAVASPDRSEVAVGYQDCIKKLGHLVSEHPDYASARNNRAQALRRLYGDTLLLAGGQESSSSILQDVDLADRHAAAKQALSDLDRAIILLTPPTPWAAISPQAAKTLAMAHTQRAAIYHMTSKSLPGRQLSVDPERREARWAKLDFEENASRDFERGGAYGNQVAKALAVSVNPTAKLCGQMVQEAMKKEYGLESSM